MQSSQHLNVNRSRVKSQDRSVPEWVLPGAQWVTLASSVTLGGHGFNPPGALAFMLSLEIWFAVYESVMDSRLGEVQM